MEGRKLQDKIKNYFAALKIECKRWLKVVEQAPILPAHLVSAIGIKFFQGQVVLNIQQNVNNRA